MCCSSPKRASDGNHVQNTCGSVHEQAADAMMVMYVDGQLDQIKLYYKTKKKAKAWNKLSEAQPPPTGPVPTHVHAAKWESCVDTMFHSGFRAAADVKVKKKIKKKKTVRFDGCIPSWCGSSPRIFSADKIPLTVVSDCLFVQQHPKPESNNNVESLIFC